MAAVLESFGKLMASTHTEMQAGFVRQQIDQSPIMDMLNFGTVGDIELIYIIESDINEAQTRAPNANYVQQTVTEQKISIALKNLGDSFAADRQLLRRKSKDQIRSWVQMQSEAINRSIPWTFKNLLVNGNTITNSTQPVGAKQHVDLFDAATNRIKFQFAEGANGVKISVATNLQMMASLDKLINGILGKPTFIIANQIDIDNIYQKAVTGAVNNVFAGLLVRRDITVNGLEQNLMVYRGVPFIDIGETTAGVEILPQTEVLGSSGANCSSMYGFKMGEDFWMPLQKEPIELFNEVERPGRVFDLEWVVAFAYKNRRSVTRLEGILKE